MTDGFWAGRRVLVTGHTGFKGAWLTIWLTAMGAEVTGLALAPPTDPSLWRLSGADLGSGDIEGDVRDLSMVTRTLQQARPDVVFHLAAQALVREGYRRPLGTFEVNVIGTANVLEAALSCPSVGAVVVVTSDKVYDHRHSAQPFDESAVIGGTNPYSASKACAEMVATAYRESFFRARGVPVVTARAGNVIGGGDWAADRLVPDVVRMLDTGTPVGLRYPNATRPWQHVLDPLAGYLMLAEHALTATADMPDALNFGPPLANCIPVREVVDRLSVLWGGAPGWTDDGGPAPAEDPVLSLSSDLATKLLGWQPVLDLDQALAWTAAWYDEHRRGGDVLALTQGQIHEYQARATP